MLRIAICDDDEYSIKRVKTFVAGYAKTKNVQISISTFLSGVVLLEDFAGYDLIFLDIEMPGLNGIEVAKRIGERGSIGKIVYTTSHKCYMQQAFHVHAFEYMVKPFSIEEITTILDDFVRSIASNPKHNVLMFKIGKSVTCFETDEIFYFEYKGNEGVRIINCSNDIFVHYTLQDILEMTEEYGFAVPHKSIIVNLRHIKSIKGFDIFISNGDVLPVAQKRATSFREAHNKFLQGDE